ncbi:MAG TPA: ATP synthase subunit I [Pyrinomonadaceae bacterium]|nr:ATP synthase subunit I [Pyrinomonadaceae bacterium]
MSQIANSVSTEGLARGDAGALELRVFRVMIASVGLAVIVSTMLQPWRVTTGLMLGGLLSLLNFHWLETSVAAVFNVDVTERPRVRISRYIIRYFVVAGAAFAAYELRLVSLPAMFAGLSSFVPALFIEASRQFYFAIIRREESF